MEKLTTEPRERAPLADGQPARARRQRAPSQQRVAQFDVFLSHNSQDKPIIERLAHKLRETGLEPWLDRWYLTGGGIWQEDLAAALRSSATCAIFVGANGFGDWAREELMVAQDRAAKDRSFRLIPVLLPGLPEPFDPSAVLPPFLLSRSWVDLRGGTSDAAAFQRLVSAVRGTSAGPISPAVLRDEVCPYRGLDAFDEEHAAFYFGRDADIQRLLEKLKSSRFLAVVGPSGSGKSSLVRAGLLPALHRGELRGSNTWPAIVVKPGPTPLTSLAARLVDLDAGAERLGSVLQLQEHLRQSHEALHLATLLSARDCSETARTVVVFDEFEEIFTLHPDDAQRQQFLANLVYAATVPGGHTQVVLTLRADFYQRCAAYPELASQISAHQYLVSPMTTDGLREVIEQPAHLAGLELEAGLVEAVLEDAGQQPGTLPLLEHALWELWQRRNGNVLTLRAYQQSGRVRGALAKRADQVFSEGSPEDQASMRRIMLALIEPGRTTEDTRRRTTMSELVSGPGARNHLEHVVRVLVDARLLTMGHDETTGDETVEVAHEALIHSWPRLRGWIDEERQGLLLHRRVREAANEWRQHNRDASYLFGGGRLLEIKAYTDREPREWTTEEGAFLKASYALEAARARGRYMRSVGEVAGGAAGTGAAYGAAFALQFWVRSQVSPAERLVITAAAFLVMFAANLPTGLGIGLALRLWRKSQSRRVIAAVLLGGVPSLLVYLVFLLLFGSLAGRIEAPQIAAGALFGAGLGLGTAIGRTRRERVLTTLLAGVLATVLARLINGINWDWPVAIVGGFLLGGLTALGFYLMSVDGDDDHHGV